MIQNRSETKGILLYANPETNADILYFGGFHAPDPFIAVGVGERKIGVMSPLEIGRAARESGFSEVLSLVDLKEAAQKRLGIQRAGIPEIIYILAQNLELRELRVPDDFPLGIARALESMGLTLEPVAAPFFPERMLKTAEQAACVRAGNALSSVGFKVVETVLSAAQVDGRGRLLHEGKVLTSEILQTQIAQAILARGGTAQHTIVAGGDHACDPHERGHGPLRVNELIIVDIFPRVNRTHYFGDMTRTYLKGVASPEQRRIVCTVREAQKKAMASLRAGVSGNDVHSVVEAYFASQGYKTERTAAGYRGFFHGTGHGLGLEIHEGPRVSAGGGLLQAGMVVTIEPGLYYPGLGGCRIEDVVQITEDGYTLLSKHGYRWELA